MFKQNKRKRGSGEPAPLTTSAKRAKKSSVGAESTAEIITDFVAGRVACFVPSCRKSVPFSSLRNHLSSTPVTRMPPSHLPSPPGPNAGSARSLADRKQTGPSEPTSMRTSPKSSHPRTNSSKVLPFTFSIPSKAPPVPARIRERTAAAQLLNQQIWMSSRSTRICSVRQRRICASAMAWPLPPTLRTLKVACRSMGIIHSYSTLGSSRWK